MINKETNEDAVATNTSDEKKPWITPSATVEQVSNVTRNAGGNGGDAIVCHT